MYDDNNGVKEFDVSLVLKVWSVVLDLLEQEDENVLFILQTS